MSWCVVALGSNISPRRRFLALARDRLREGGFAFTRQSTIVTTAPVGGPPGQQDYLNQVLAAPQDAVSLGPRELLDLALAIEREAGRERRVRWGPRTLDIDLILHGERVLDEPGLRVPHPRLHERRFVLEPLVEILPDAIHPTLGLSTSELLASLAGL